MLLLTRMSGHDVANITASIYISTLYVVLYDTQILHSRDSGVDDDVLRGRDHSTPEARLHCMAPAFQEKKFKGRAKALCRLSLLT